MRGAEATRAGRSYPDDVISKTARLSTLAAGAANRAEARVTLTAVLPRGSSEARCANSTYRGKPGGCATPRVRAARINSPLSTSVTMGASVQTYSPNAAANTARAQKALGLNAHGVR